MPNKPRPENRHRMVRVEDELWEAAKEAARANDTTVSAGRHPTRLESFLAETLDRCTYTMLR